MSESVNGTECWSDKTTGGFKNGSDDTINYYENQTKKRFGFFVATPFSRFPILIVPLIFTMRKSNYVFLAAASAAYGYWCAHFMEPCNVIMETLNILEQHSLKFNMNAASEIACYLMKLFESFELASKNRRPCNWIEIMVLVA